MDYATFTAGELARAIASNNLNQLNAIQEYLMECNLPEREQLLAGVRKRATAIRTSVAAQV